MSKYRCPVCGAPHREPVRVCRQCGQAMGGDVRPYYRKPDARYGARFGRKTVLPYIVIGVFLVALLLVLAVGLGITNTEGPVGDALNEIPFLKPENDGWEIFDDPSGVWRAELPEPPQEQDVIDATAEGTTTTYVSPITDRMDLAVAYTSGARLDSGADTLQQLVPIADNYVASVQGAYMDDPVVTSFKGYPALAFSVDEFSYYGERAYLHGLIILVDDEAVIATTKGIEIDPDQHQRLLDNLEILIGNEEASAA